MTTDGEALPTPEAPQAVDPADAASAQRAEAEWLLATQVQALTQRAVTLHANLLHAQRRVAELEGQVADLEAAVTAPAQEREQGT